MTLLLSGSILALAWFAVVNLLLSAAARAVAPLASCHSRGRPSALLAVRLFPAAGSLLFVLGVFLPAHWLLEAPETGETFGAVLWGLAGLSTVLLIGSTLRALAALRDARALRRAWSAQALSNESGVLTIAGASGLSLAGLVRPTIVLGTHVKAALTSEELEVAVAHEAAHRRAWDNLKRFAVFAAPDFFRFTPTARLVEREWHAEVECAADDSAVGESAARAVSLASALLKVARLAHAPSPRHAELWSTFHDPALLDRRVRRLVEGETLAGARRQPVTILLASMASAVAIACWLGGLTDDVHRLTELLVRLLP